MGERKQVQCWHFKLLWPTSVQRAELLRIDARYRCMVSHKTAKGQACIEGIFYFEKPGKTIHYISSVLKFGKWRAVQGPHATTDHLRKLDRMKGTRLCFGEPPQPGRRSDLLGDLPKPDESIKAVMDRSRAALDAIQGKQIHLMEFYANKGRTSSVVRSMNGIAFRVGIDHFQNLNSTATRTSLFSFMKRQPPACVLFAPVCKDWCQFASLNAAMIDGFEEYIKRSRNTQVRSLQFMVSVCLWQHSKGRSFVIEQPWRSKMLKLKIIRRLQNELGDELHWCRVDQCAFGLRDPKSKLPYQKATAVLTNNKFVADAVSRRCVCKTEHQPLSGETTFRGRSVARTKFAECYPHTLAKAFATAIMSSS